MTSQQRPNRIYMIARLLMLVGLLALPSNGQAAVMNDYCIQPPFISQVVPPLVMFTMDKEHRLFTEAYSDSFDLDGDGKIETTYKHSIEYYGYFDPNKCYTYSTSANDFEPANYSTQTGTDATGKPTYNRFCAAAQWSGNILNWLTMSRMDVLKKVLYGGQRVNPDATNKTTLQRVYIPQDAHSFGKEYTGRLCYDGSSSYTNMCATDSDCDSGYTCQDKSLQLIGIAAPPVANNCNYSSDIAWTDSSGNGNDKILVATYNHDTGASQDTEIGASHQNIMDSFVPANFSKYYYVKDFNTNDTTAANNDLIATESHGDNNSFIAVAEFNVASNKKGTWSFFLDSDDGAELYVDGSPVASYYSVSGTSGHSASCGTNTAPTANCAPASATGTIDLSASGYHRLVVRGTNYQGNSGAMVWYKMQGDTTWSRFGGTNLNLRSPIIPSSTANCTMQTADFISTGQPTKGVVQEYHLFCNKSTTGNNSYGPPLLRMLTNRQERIWDWISREVVQCGNTLGTGTAVTPTDYDVNVEVCNPDIGLEPNCKQYGTGTSATQKPIGLLQKYGDSDGTKVCSKTLAKPCSSDSDCRPGSNNGTDLGMCVDKSRMYFGLITGSYAHNLQGGILRKNINSISDEVDTSNGFFKLAQNIPSNMVQAIDMLQIIDYTDATTNYANCVTQDKIISDGLCRDWGNPLAEILYEALRYYAGKGTPTSGFDYPQNQNDGGLNLPHPAYWGYEDGTRTFKGPYDVYPSCSKPFVLLLSDVYPSFDADQLPGVTNSAYTEDTTVHPVLGLDRTVSGKKYLSKLMDDIATTESVTGNSFFIGNNGTAYDFICTPKTASNMSLLRGLCPEQPTRQGSFYTAALAYYAHSFMNTEIKKDTTTGINTNIPNAQTFAVALASQVGNWTVKVGGNLVRIVPFGKSVSGAANLDTACKNNSTFTSTTFDSDGKLKTMIITPNNANAYCPTDEIVKVYTESIKYDASGNPIYLSFRINFADAEQGADYDMDAVGWYEICTQAAKDAGYGTCGTAMDPDQVEIKVVSDYAAGGIDQVLGFILSGTKDDGTYLVVRDKSVAAGESLPNSLPFNWSHTFTVTGSNTGVLKDPLWYAAKWGGFQDKNGNNVPDLKSEWAKDCTETDVTKCNPDNYYLVVNPLKLEGQLEKAFNDILNRVSSGTAASILNNSEGSGANLLQAVFYPKKPFDNGTEANWIGEMQNLWYYVDPKLNNTSIREDTDQNNIMNLKNDKIAQFYFDPSQSQTLVKLFSDSNGDGIADNPTTPDASVEPDSVNSLWKAGKLLWQRNLTTDPRTIYTGYNSTAGNTPQRLINADGSVNTIVSQTATLDLLDIPSSLSTADRQTKANKLISYVQGKDQDPDTDGTLYRSRKVTINGCGISDSQGCTREWKLGDIISSTPKIVSNVKLNNYNLTPPSGYNDTSYNYFINSSTYKTRGMVFVGGNDGMLHAFKMGVLKELNSKYDKARINDSEGNLANAADHLGREEWAYIPKQALPYLKYLTDPDYSHLYYIDRTPNIVDASIGVTAEACSGDYSTCTKKNDGSTWRTVLIGGMGFGGANKNSTDSCTKGASGTCVKTPIDGTGYSSYFALDVTDPENPKTMWEFYGNTTTPGTLGYSLTGPAIIRIAKKDTNGNPDNTKNGKWFAVFGSGPSGPIDTLSHEFKGESSQELQLFVVDLATGSLVTTIHTGITNAFSGSLASSWIDSDRSKMDSKGYYSDDAIYIGYTQKDTTTGTWTKGGVVRVLTRESDDPGSSDTSKQWTSSVLIDGVGPVTTSITKLLDRANKNLWIYFGTGRYFFKTDDNATTSQQKIIGVREPCFSTANRTMMLPIAGGTDNDIDQNCSDKAGTLVDQTWDATRTPTSSLSSTAAGWSIDLSVSDSSFLAERIITDPVASPAGAVFFTSFRPSAEICKFGGDSSVWAVNYANGNCPPCTSIQGKGLMQVSTGAFAEIDLKDSYCCTSCPGNCGSNPPPPRMPQLNPIPPGGDGGSGIPPTKLPYPISGVPPTAQGFSLITNPPPIKKFLHVKEK